MINSITYYFIQTYGGRIINIRNKSIVQLLLFQNILRKISESVNIHFKFHLDLTWLQLRWNIRSNHLASCEWSCVGKCIQCRRLINYLLLLFINHHTCVCVCVALVAINTEESCCILNGLYFNEYLIIWFLFQCRS